MNTYNKNLEWRYATKKFDTSKTISQTDMEILQESVRLSASSYGLQPYKVVVIKDPKVRELLKEAAWNQSQITDASHLMVFANSTIVDEQTIDKYIKEVANTRDLDTENLKQYGNFMKGKVTTLPDESKQNWTAKQAYIAVGNLLSAAAFLKIDTCPMEGFDSKSFNKILKLDEKNLNACCIVALGYRSESDQTQYLKKVRKPKDQLFETI